MGSALSRNVRDLFEIAGCDGISPMETPDQEEEDINDINAPTRTVKKERDVHRQTNPRPLTPVPHHRTRLLSQDPRSPSVGILRTPIEVATPVSKMCCNESAVENVEETPRMFLETDLDSFGDYKQSDPCTPVGGISKAPKLLPGLSASHLLKLKFLGMDPRSPSEGIARTPIQILDHPEESSDEDSFKNRLTDISSGSSRSLFNYSDDYLDISKACCEPPALLSDYEVSKDWDLSFNLSSHEEQVITSNSCNEEATAEPIREIEEDTSKESSNLSDCPLSTSGQDAEVNIQQDIPPIKENIQEKIQPTTVAAKAASVIIFREDCTKTPQNTPKKKSTRTPLTPICNMTPNDVRSKKIQGRLQDKEKLMCKILSGNENTPTKQSAGFIKKEKKSFGDENCKILSENANTPTKQSAGLLKIDKKPFGDENSKLVEWDQDTTVII